MAAAGGNRRQRCSALPRRPHTLFHCLEHSERAAAHRCFCERCFSRAAKQSSGRLSRVAASTGSGGLHSLAMASRPAAIPSEQGFLHHCLRDQLLGQVVGSC